MSKLHEFGRMEPLPDGDPIPLLKKKIRIGRRDGCDIVLNYANISGHHAMLEIFEGYWFIKDLRSRNGISVDGQRILQGIRKRIDPNIVFAIAKHQFIIRYDPEKLGAFGTPPPDEIADPLFGLGGMSRGVIGVRPWDSPRKPPPLGGAADPPDEE